MLGKIYSFFMGLLVSHNVVISDVSVEKTTVDLKSDHCGETVVVLDEADFFGDSVYEQKSVDGRVCIRCPIHCRVEDKSEQQVKKHVSPKKSFTEVLSRLMCKLKSFLGIIYDNFQSRHVKVIS